MKSFVAATLIALASVATAQLPDIPQCAFSCFVTPLTTDGCANLEDFACHCKKADSLFAAVTPCVQKSCSAAEQAEVISTVEKTCAENGITVSVPSTGASSTPAPSSSSTSATEASTTSSSTAEPTTSTPYSTSASGVPTPSSNGTAPTTAPSPSPSEFPGAAARVTQAAGLLGAVAIALFAL